MTNRRLLAEVGKPCNNSGMGVVEETTAIVAALPQDKARTVLQFARFLAEEDDEQAWQEQFAAARKSPRFRQRLAEVDRGISQAKASPLDPCQFHFCR